MNLDYSLFSNLSTLKKYIETCERRRLDLDDAEIWSGSYLPKKRMVNTKDSYQGKVLFKHVKIKVIGSNESFNRMWSFS